jgi:hypothetical protein
MWKEMEATDIVFDVIGISDVNLWDAGIKLSPVIKMY